MQGKRLRFLSVISLLLGWTFTVGLASGEPSLVFIRIAPKNGWTISPSTGVRYRISKWNFKGTATRASLRNAQTRVSDSRIPCDLCIPVPKRLIMKAFG